jgi:type VI secretion system secreted protein Hcp
MAVTICLKIDGVDGESTIVKHEKSIDVLSWNWGMSQSASAHISTGASSGSADVRDLTFTHYIDRASPNLLKNCFLGSNHKSAVLTVMRSTGAAGSLAPIVTMTMSDTVFISSVHTGDQGDNDRFVETVTLNFATVKFEYTGQDKDNKPIAAVSTGDLKIAQKA